MPADDFEVSSVVHSSIRIRRDERAIFKLHGRAEAAPLRFTDRRFRVELDAVLSEVELKAVVSFGAEKCSHAQRWLEVPNSKGQQQAFVMQPQQRHIHLAVVAEVTDVVEGFAAVDRGKQDEVIGLIVARFDGSVFDREFVTVNSDERPDPAAAGLPQPRLAAKEAIDAFEVARLTAVRLVPRRTAVG